MAASVVNEASCSESTVHKTVPLLPGQSERKPNSEGNVWRKKFVALQRICSEYEELNNNLLARTLKIHEVIERTENEKKFLLKRLENFQGFELPNVKSWDSALDSPDEDCDIAAAASRIRAELDAELYNAQDQSTLNSVPPSRLGPYSNDSTVEAGPTTPKARMPNGQTVVVTTPKQNNTVSSPAASIILTPTLVSATVPVPIGMTAATNVAPVKSKKVTKGAKRESGSTEKGTTKKRKTDVDPNAPKKPSNAFFWFCQDKRAILQEQFRGEGMAGQHDLTKALAKLWSETKIEDRKIYYERYATDKARYEKEMEVYIRNKQISTTDPTPQLVTITSAEL